MTRQTVIARDTGTGVAITVLSESEAVGIFGGTKVELPYVGSYLTEDDVHAAAALAIVGALVDRARTTEVPAAGARATLADLVAPRPAPTDDPTDLFRTDLRELWNDTRPGLGRAELKRQLAAVWPALYRILDAEVGA